MIEARARGFDNCLMCDMLGNVAELGTANIFMVKDGVVFTPAANGTFLAGITRARVIALLRDAGITVVETTLRYSDFQTADEIFSTGNYTKVSPINRIDERDLQPGPVYRRARELYWEYAHADGVSVVGSDSCTAPYGNRRKKAGPKRPRFLKRSRSAALISSRLRTSRPRSPN